LSYRTASTPACETAPRELRKHGHPVRHAVAIVGVGAADQHDRRQPGGRVRRPGQRRAEIETGCGNDDRLVTLVGCDARSRQRSRDVIADDLEGLPRNVEPHKRTHVVRVQVDHQRGTGVVEHELVVVHVERRRRDLHLLGGFAAKTEDDLCAGARAYEGAVLGTGRRSGEAPREHGMSAEEGVGQDDRLWRDRVGCGNRRGALHSPRHGHAVAESGLERDVDAANA
jgi:hypothetical protein